MKNRETFQQIDTSSMAADDGVSVGDCCLPIQYAEGDESEDDDPWTLSDYLLAAILGGATLALDLLILSSLGAF